MNTPRHLNNQAGFTLMELMLSLGILVVGTYLVVTGVGEMENMTLRNKVLSATERQINMIVDNIRTGLSSYQISYDSSMEAREAALELTALPMAWDPGLVVPVASCGTGCPGGRYGFIVQPLPNNPGLYIATLRMSHRDWKDSFRDYQFLVTVQ